MRRILCAIFLAAEAIAADIVTAGAPHTVAYPTGARPREVTVADLDGDRRPDLAVANSGDGTLTLLLGAGGGRLRAASTVDAGPEPSDVEAIDLDRDGDLDLVVANHETSRITVLRNDGHARFSPFPGSPFETGSRPHVHGLACGDFDADGWPDVAVESADTREIRILRGGPRGFRPPMAVRVGTMPYSRIGAADLDRDGIPEILVPGHGDNTVRVVRHRPGGFASAEPIVKLSEQPWMVLGADVNGDGRADILVVQTNSVGIWLGGARGFRRAPRSPVQVRGATEIAAGDLDGDGIADLAIGPWEGDQVTVLRGPRQESARILACARPTGLAIADLDGDRRGELIATCATENRVVIVSLP